MAAQPPESKPHVDIVRAIKDAALTGLLAFGLFLPLIGFQTVTNMRNELELDTRWPLLAWFVAIVAGGRLLYSLVLAPWRARDRKSTRLNSSHVAISYA